MKPSPEPAPAEPRTSPAATLNRRQFLTRSAALLPPDWIELVRRKVESLDFGVVQLIVHNGRVTQIERTEKTRLPVGGGGMASH